MAYNSTANPPSRIDSGALTQRSIRESTSINEGNGIWRINTTDTLSLLQGSSYFSNAAELGIVGGDILIASMHTTEASSGHSLCMGVLQYDSTSAASLSTGGTFTSTGYGG